MVVFVLDDVGVEPADFRLDHLALAIDPGIAHPGVPWDGAAHAGDGQTALPSQQFRLTQQFDDRVDQDGVADWGFVRPVGSAGQDAEDEQAQGHVDLRRGEAGTAGVLHRLHHIGDQTADMRCAGVGDRFGTLEEHRVAHAGDFEDGHRAQSFGVRKRLWREAKLVL